MVWTSVARFSDPEACERAMQGVSGVEIIPTARGQFDTEVTKVRFDRLWMQRFESSLPQVLVCALPADRQAISFLTRESSPKLFYCGQELRPGAIAILSQDMMHKRFEAGLRKGAMSMPKGELSRIFRSIAGYDFIEKNELRLRCPDAEAMVRLLSLYRVITKMARDTSDILDIPEVGRALEQKLTHLMVRCLMADHPYEGSVTSRHEATMRHFEAFLEKNADRAVYLAEVCAALGSSERTLRAACEEHLGMGPIRYLTMRRMHLVHRALRRADFSETTVTHIATGHGFWELGRFSVSYRTLFGESPSETLRRPPDRSKTALSRPASPAFT